MIFFSFFPHFSIGIAEILGQRSPRYFRSPGLLSGFDMSGLLNIIGILLIVIKDKVDFKSVINLLLLLIAGFLSSRGTIIIVAIILLYFILTLHKKECGNFLKLALYLFVSFVTCFTLMFIYQIYLLMSDQESVIPLDFINKIFAMGSDDNLKEMYFLPKTELGLLFGLGGESGRIDGYLHSDVGYVREVFKYGILGLVGVLFIHSIIYLQAWIACKDKKTFKLLIFMGILAVVLSFKNNYFFTRAFFPCLMLLQIYSYKSLRVDCLSADKSKIIN
ncbi:hypothetical protein [Vibrio splendidus]|uniref:hypothetical protein n=1 Tax=Vibrio splendidus TaxID=29497 RepID=UPI001FB53A70|nr:hypothetical protein [Vibrio splendidus]UOE85835.1 hypothetical protein LTQ54_07640 [Vibrio splendidus]